jgi:hypothetical protein
MGVGTGGTTRTAVGLGLATRVGTRTGATATDGLGNAVRVGEGVATVGVGEW